MKYSDLSAMAQAYLEAAAFTDCGPDAEESMREGSWSPEAYEHAQGICAAFETSNETDLSKAGDDSQNGHDLWLTRNRHGAGFWDRGYDKAVADRLTFAAHALGEVWIYAGDNGLIYLFHVIGLDFSI